MRAFVKRAAMPQQLALLTYIDGFGAALVDRTRGGVMPSFHRTWFSPAYAAGYDAGLRRSAP